jgi:hypothetical protein
LDEGAVEAQADWSQPSGQVATEPRAVRVTAAQAILTAP